MLNIPYYAPEPFEIYRKMPKCNLHTHLEGSVRPQTFLELAQAQGLSLPFEPADVDAWLQVNGEEKSLVDYLDKIMVNYQVLKAADALRRTTFEAAEDAYRDGVIYFEMRAGPVTHAHSGLPVALCIESMLAGLQEAEAAFGIVCRLIISGLRNHDPRQNEDLARLAVRYMDQGVVGFDLAGDEAGFPADLHRGAFALLMDSGLGITVHAGEASGHESVRYAVGEIGAGRIGHGVRSVESLSTMALLQERGVLLEVCPTSNVHTGTVPSIQAHPVKTLYAAGIRISIGDDDPITSRTRVSNELTILDSVFGFTPEQVLGIQLIGMEASFLREPDIKASLLAKMRAFSLNETSF